TNNVHPFSTLSESDQFSQEFQLIGSAFDDRMSYVAGLFYFQEETENRRSVSLLGPFSPAISNLFFLSASSTELRADNEAIAAFAQVEWEFNDNWRTTLGVRYTDEKRELERDRFDPDPATLDANGGFAAPVGGGLYAVNNATFEYNPNFGFLPLDTVNDDISNDDFSPMASIAYIFDYGDLIDTGSMYLTWSRGFLSGGLSEAPSGALEEFDPEEVENIELGIKVDLLDRRLRVNAALFYSDYSDRQLTTVVINPQTNAPAGATINAEETTIQGFELETTWLPGANWLVNFNMSINDGDIETFDDIQLTIGDPSSAPDAGCTRADLSVLLVDSCPNDRSGENLPRLPEQTYFLAAQYSLQTGLGTFIPRVQASLKKDIEYCFDAASCASGRWLEDEQFDLSARVTWISRDSRWVGAIYGTNLTEEEYFVGGTALIESSGVGGLAYNEPRIYGAEIEYSF
ncbi:MAG: TonB-dependent receptor, partial [Pseudomonadota bacterium]